jgi:rhamnosyltransferase subunit B
MRSFQETARERRSIGIVPGRRIVLTVFGTLGDLHPFLAIALELKTRGHQVIVASYGRYREQVETLGLGFHTVRPDLYSQAESDPALARQVMDRRRGLETVIRQLMAQLRDSFDDLSEAARGADLLVSHSMTFGTRLVAEVQGIRWASMVMAPSGLLSAYDPPVIGEAPYLTPLRSLGPGFHRPLFWLMRRVIRSWGKPWHRLRSELGLPPAGEPVLDGQHSPELVLAHFSPLLGAPQPDWPSQARLTGFPFFDPPGNSQLHPDLETFLNDGPPPIVFTLGSSAVLDPGSFYAESITAATSMGRRAVLLVGSDAGGLPTGSLPEGVVAFAYAPFSELFPRSAAVVHQGGIGSVGLAMRAGVPMLIVPHAFDQPDNAARAARLGVARVIPRGRYTATRATSELRRLLEGQTYVARAAEVRGRIHDEDGVGAACDALEGLMDEPHRGIHP